MNPFMLTFPLCSGQILMMPSVIPKRSDNGVRDFDFSKLLANQKPYPNLLIFTLINQLQFIFVFFFRLNAKVRACFRKLFTLRVDLHLLLEIRTLKTTLF